MSMYQPNHPRNGDFLAVARPGPASQAMVATTLPLTFSKPRGVTTSPGIKFSRDAASSLEQPVKKKSPPLRPSKWVVTPW